MTILDWGICERADARHPLHRTWATMIRAAYQRPDSGRTVCAEWKYFDVFRQWAEPRWFPGKRLVLLPMETEYSPSTCVLASGRAAALLSTPVGKANDFPIGVTSYRPGVFVARGRDSNGKLKHIGVFDTAMAAHQAWQKHKVEALRQVAEQCEKVGEIDVAVALYDYALMIGADVATGVETLR